MVVGFEFLDNEPIENLITCMNFKMDKVVFFGYEEEIKEQKVKTESFLKKHCGVQTVEFQDISPTDLQSTITTMRKKIQKEKSQGNAIYFDITGGGNVALVAFGILSKEFEVPIHMYDVPSNKLSEMDENPKISISKNVAVNDVRMTLELLAEMHGGKINTNLKKDLKDMTDSDFVTDVEKIYEVAKDRWDLWNPFSQFLRNTLTPTDTDHLLVQHNARTVINALTASRTNLNTVNELNDIVDALAKEGILLNVKHSNGQYKFRYKNQKIKDCLWEAGSILELHTYQIESINSDECQVGVYLDWDGVIHASMGQDVLNEVDVLSLHGNVPTFISCKTGNMGSPKTLHALYELQTVASRFGGKYARKVLMTTSSIGDIYAERAKEMGIEVRC